MRTEIEVSGSSEMADEPIEFRTVGNKRKREESELGQDVEQQAPALRPTPDTDNFVELFANFDQQLSSLHNNLLSQFSKLKEKNKNLIQQVKKQQSTINNLEDEVELLKEEKQALILELTELKTENDKLKAEKDVHTSNPQQGQNPASPPLSLPFTGEISLQAESREKIKFGFLTPTKKTELKYTINNKPIFAIDLLGLPEDIQKNKNPRDYFKESIYQQLEQAGVFLFFKQLNNEVSFLSFYPFNENLGVNHERPGKTITNVKIRMFVSQEAEEKSTRILACIEKIDFEKIIKQARDPKLPCTVINRSKAPKSKVSSSREAQVTFSNSSSTFKIDTNSESSEMNRSSVNNLDSERIVFANDLTSNFIFRKSAAAGQEKGKEPYTLIPESSP